MNAPLRCCLFLIPLFPFVMTGVCRADESKIKNMGQPEDFVARYERALATQEWGEVAPLIHPECTVTFSNGSCHQGKENVQAAFEKNFELIKNEEYAISEVHWVVKTEHVAVYTFAYRWAGLIGGEEASGSGRGTSTLVNEEGKWLLVSEHLGPGS